jgi:hypothetical protein
MFSGGMAVTIKRAFIFLFRDHLHPGVHRVQDWLSSHFAERARLPHLAKLAKMSSRNLVRAFKTATGLTPLQYQQRLRLRFENTRSRLKYCYVKGGLDPEARAIAFKLPSGCRISRYSDGHHPRVGVGHKEHCNPLLLLGYAQ